MMAKKNGIKYITLKARMSIGWDAERAVTTPLQDTEGRRANAFLASQHRRKYPIEWQLVAKDNGIALGTFRQRMLNGWVIKIAATLLPSPYNCTLRLKELYGEDYYRRHVKWLFAPGRIKRGVKQ